MKKLQSLLLFSLLLWSCFYAKVVAQQSASLCGKDFSQLYNVEDSLFQEPFIDIDEWRETPVKHRYIHGGFKDNNTRFSYYFPEETEYTGRFFQYITPFPDNEFLSQAGKGEEDKISFAINHGAYFIETNGGGSTDFTKDQKKSNNPLIGAYLANAASARFSRVIANELFADKRPFGYAFGGSGGAYRTVGSIENTNQVWDGVVPYVMGSPMAIPNVFTVRMHAMRILNDKLPQIIDALEPGGSGDPYSGLNEEEKEALLEVTRMGFPPQSWFGYRTMGIHGFLVLYRSIVAMDNSYFTEDFWHKPGYLGFDAPESFKNARIQQTAHIASPISIDEAVALNLAKPLSPAERGTADAAWKSMGGTGEGMPVAFRLDTELPDIQFLGGDLQIKGGKKAGKVLQLTTINKEYVVLGPADAEILINLAPGDEVQVDNSNFLAVQTYHRHQVPSSEYTVWDQFRNENGTPVYPQRPMQLGPIFAQGAGGVLPTGKFDGKMILLESGWDREAFAWQADWYYQRVKANLGDETDQNFRLWITDRALHGDVSIEDDPTRTVSYLGSLQQALLDLSDWVERGIEPAKSTSYTISDGQVILPQSAAQRNGIQPVVTLTANGEKATVVKINEPVSFIAEVEIPSGMGKLTHAAWNFEGLPDDSGESNGWSFSNSPVFPVMADFDRENQSDEKVLICGSYQFSEPGIYFPTLRVAAQRNGNPETPFTQIQHLDRVRVVVE